MVFPIPDVQKVDSKQPPSRDKEQLNKKVILRKRKTKSAKKAEDSVYNLDELAAKVHKHKSKRDKDKFAVGMSSWAEHFTAAATWQMKHELAYWKAKAVSLKYENKILHDIIRKNCSDAPKVSQTTPKAGPEFDFLNGPIPKMYTVHSETEPSEEEMSEEEHEEEYEERHEENCEEDGQWEASEEYIEFLVKNAKFKEDARRERERLKGLRAGKSEVDILEAEPSEQKNNSAEMKELYGANWQKVVALEMSIQSHFINESDKLKPSFWPNIPFNFG